MHSYVEKVNKLDQDGKVILSFSGLAAISKKSVKDPDFSQPSPHGNEDSAHPPASAAHGERLNRSQEIECINELDSENEFSYIEIIPENEKASAKLNQSVVIKEEGPMSAS
jgi:hypothetical protein